MMKPILLGMLLLAGTALPALAQDATGTWLRESGVARIRISPCGNALCGTVIWLKNPGGPGKVGQQVLVDMKPSAANEWRGTAFNPEDGKTYSGTMSLNGNHMVTAGCVLGGLICKSVNWQRVR
jgi:uncharacterized protein (DUF2147 family)